MGADNLSIQNAKRTLRREMRERLSAIPGERHRHAGVVLSERFGDVEQRLFVFASMRGEINTWPLLHARWEAGRAIALPKVEPEGIRFFSVTGKHELSPGTLGIGEPADSCPPTLPAAGDTVLVPGLAFTPDGARLGRGGGYYDRFLASMVDGVSTIGICYDIQICESLPCTERDIPVGTVFQVQVEPQAPD